MSKCVFDKNTVNEQLVLLSNLLENQREIKKTLLSYLEKVSDFISNSANTENSEALVSCLSNVQEIFDNIKSNIDKLIELKLFIDNISKSTSLNVIDFEKYYNQFIELSEKIETTNNSYNDFMEKLTSIPSIDFSNLNYQKAENLKDLEAEPLIEVTVEQPSTEDVIVEENIEVAAIENVQEQEIETIPEETVEENTTVETVTENISETKSNIETSVEQPSTEDDVIVEENIEVAAIENNISEPYLSERTLFIDNDAQIAILPYSLFDLEEYFSENPEKYSSINDIIEKEYTVSLDKYENTSIARFKQTFKLAKERSNLSFFEALNYANKLLFESEVEPIIIASCNNIDELEVYLDCLNNDVLNKFNCFTIINK